MRREKVNNMTRARRSRPTEPVKPTKAEQKLITAQLVKKYPQMYTTKLTASEIKAIKDLDPADRKTIMRQIGLELKDIYKK